MGRHRGIVGSWDRVEGARCTATACILLTLLAGCDNAPPQSAAAPAAHNAHASSNDPAWFEVVPPAESGIDFVHVSGHHEAFLMPEIMGGGGALLDIDNDGDLDLYLVQSGSLHSPAPAPAPGNTPARTSANQLYRNNGNGTFTNITDSSGAGDTGYGQGCAAGDFDNDGFVDIYITNVGANTLLRNNGDTTFTDVTQAAGVGHEGWGASAAFFDYDRDGDSDLFVANYLNWSKSTELDCYNHMGAKDYCSPQNYNAPAMDVLYRNNGDGTFTDVTTESGIASDFGTGLAVVVADFDNNGWLDVFVANDGMKDQLWMNMTNGTFVDAALRVGCAVDLDGTEKAGMGVAAADLDDDADVDFIVCNLNQQSDSLYRNDNGYFADITAIAGLGATSRPFTRFGMGWHDFNHDTMLDLYQVNGRVMMQAELYPAISGTQPGATQHSGTGASPVSNSGGTQHSGTGVSPVSASPPPKAQRTGEGQGGGSSPSSSSPPPANSPASPDPYAEPNLLFKGVAPFKFQEVKPRGGTNPVISSTSRAGIFGDIDNDHDVDIIIVNRDGPVTVMRNIASSIPAFSSNHAVTFHLVDEQGRTVEHALLSLQVGDRRIYRESRSAYSYLAANDPRVHVGLGAAERATRIAVRWPDGTVESFSDAEAGQMITLQRGTGQVQ